ncbi:MAG: RNA polymerase sigma factor [Sphingobacterium sp.]|jgi:RNA polymerase sigma-70 factor (ECF subfamily)|nr:RNA polymerase sigma factor [Sphingobacterium sp.]
MEKILNINEKELLRQLKAGSKAAFSELYSIYSRPLISNLLKILKNDNLAEEILQETFIALWEHRHSIDSERSALGYLIRISANKTKDLFKRAVHDRKMRAYFYPVIESGYEPIEAGLYKKENEDLLNQLIDRLPAKQKEVYRLCKIEGLSYNEVSQLLGISEATVNSHILRANKALKKLVIRNPQLLTLILISIFSN